MGGVRDVDLTPDTVHTVVLWSKDFSNLLRNSHGLRDLLASYDQLYLHFTVTGLGGTRVEPGVLPYRRGAGPAPRAGRLRGGPFARFGPVRSRLILGGGRRDPLELSALLRGRGCRRGPRDQGRADELRPVVREGGAPSGGPAFPVLDPRRRRADGPARSSSRRSPRPGASCFMPARSRSWPASRVSGRPPALTGRFSNCSTRGTSRLRAARTAASGRIAFARSRRTSAATRNRVTTVVCTATRIPWCGHAHEYDRISTDYLRSPG